MTKKTIKAPLSYDPGKGRPKEHLAYLNWQEMQELQRINGGNMERGPKGLPSFPPADARGSSSKSSSSSSRSSGGGARDSGQAASRSTSRSTSGGGGARDSGQAAARSGSSRSSGSSYGGGGRDSGRVGSRAAPAPTRSIGGGGVRSISSGPSVRGPVSRIPSSVPPSGVSRSIGLTRVPSRTPSESQISGRISRASLPTQPRDLQGPIPSGISPNEYGWAASGPSRLSAYQAQKIYGGKLFSEGEKFSQKEYDTLLNANTITNPSLNAQVNALSPQMRQNAAIISSAARLQGIDPATAIGMGAIESNLGTLKDRKGSQYQGLMQMGDAAWSESADELSRQLGKKNPWASAQAGVKYLADNRERFVSRFGAEPTARDLYGMHQQGPGGYMKLVGNPDVPAYKVVGYGAVIQNLPSSMRNEKTAKSISSEDFARIITKYPEQKLASLSGVPAGAAGQAPTQIASPSRPINQVAELTPPAYRPYGMVYPAAGQATTVEVAQAPSQAGLTKEDEKVIKQELKPAKTAIRGAGFFAGLGLGAPIGLGSGFAYKGYEKSVVNKLDAYKAATPAERDAMERRDPSIIAWAPSIGIQPQNDISMYNSWAAERGLRGPGESRGGDRGVQYAGGIGSLPSGTTAMSGTPSTPSTTATPSGVRPYEYYQWDVGVNIPSQTDPNYTNYQEYLRRRAAAQTT